GRRATMSLQTLRDNRAVLLACEAIGWVHMAGKAHPEFLRGHGGQSNGYDFKKWASSWSPDWNTRLAWLSSNNTLTWPVLSSFLTDFARVLSKKERRSNPSKYDNVVGFLQAAHAMASGIEKNHPKSTEEYLG